MTVSKAARQQGDSFGGGGPAMDEGEVAEEL
jgi:hypothetical protein